MTKAETVAAQPAGSHSFQADVARLLQMMAHSIYSDRDVFIRELLSNAADACEKLRYEALKAPDLIKEGQPFGISITIDEENKRLIFADNGIGMSREDLIESLGTIANSGTRSFLERLDSTEKGANGGDLIGQFGIGFYSVFMVADKVTVESRKAGSDEAWAWESDGKGTFSTHQMNLADAPEHGTRITLKLTEDGNRYASAPQMERIIREHSGAIAIPVELIATTGVEAKRITEGVALWRRAKSEISDTEYREFYHALAGQFDEPDLTVHWHAEGRQEYMALAFIPGSRPFDLFDPARKGRGKLYVRRVLVTSDANLLPGWLRFIRLVVDSNDLPLNVSREMIQESPIFGAIRKGITTKILQELIRTADINQEKFAQIWQNFGAVLKEGLYEDPERRDQIFKIARFATSKESEQKRSLADYISDLRPNQTDIWYMTGENHKRIASSPQLEGFRQRGIEVLLLSDPIDAFWVETAVGYDGKPFKSVTQGDVDISNVPLMEGEAQTIREPSAKVASLLAVFKQTLESDVADVRASARLSKSAACLVASANARDKRLERMLAEHGAPISISKPVLEINPSHELIVILSDLLDGKNQSLIEDIAWLIFDEAKLSDGDMPSRPEMFTDRLMRVLMRAATGHSQA